MAFFTYITASKPYGTLYTGSTDDIWQSVVEHREKTRPGFTQKYGVTRLVWVEVHGSRDELSGASDRSRNGDVTGRSNLLGR